MPVKLTDKQVVRGPKYSLVRRYFHTANMRHSIYHNRRLQLDQPWTADPIFQRYRFCNVYREYDKVTVWLRENWREPYADHPNLAFAMALARLINWPPTLIDIGFPDRWHPKRAHEKMKARKEAGLKVYTGAYLLGAIPKGDDKARYLIHYVLTPLKKVLDEGRASDGAEFPDNLERAWEYFRSFRGIGNFLAYEIVSDLRHTRYLSSAPDIMTWANAGPGALRGLTRLWGFQPKTRQADGYIFPEKRAVTAMRLLLMLSRERLPDWMPPWEMREVEHHLCETDKYLRIKEGQGVLERFRPKPSDEW